MPEIEWHQRENDEDLTLTNAERWIVVELLRATPPAVEVGRWRAEYFIRKCRNQRIERDRCAYLLDAFDLDETLSIEELLRGY